MTKRIHFFLGHLSSSVIAALIILTLVFFVWYPAPLAQAEGVTHIFLLLIAIDVIVGPLLTLLVYKEGKKTLKMDLSVIIVMQVMALSYGMYSIIQSRPVWIAQNGDIFQLVRANVVDKANQNQAKPEYQHNGWFKPQWVAVDETNSKYESYGEQTLVPNLYTNLSHANTRIIRNSQPLATLNQFNDPREVQKILQQYPIATTWMPLRTTDLGVTVLVDAQGAVVKVVNLRPWRE
ncbi:type IV pilin accessory protein [Acinetobacter sp. 1207_04]|uniref:TfpX/TfpZ family type IV pilin accessory protein n=1 Tax=Acinetobacter sp. 1207_04 TaxID=2604449 RepID=UPI00405A4A84